MVKYTVIKIYVLHEKIKLCLDHMLLSTKCTFKQLELLNFSTIILQHWEKFLKV